MSPGGDPSFMGLEGEQAVAMYRDGRLTLTDRRVIQRRGRGRPLDISLSLANVEAVGLVRRLGISWWPLLVPLTVVVISFWIAVSVGDGDILLFGLILAPFLLPLVLIAPRTVLRIATPAYRLSERVPGRHREAARIFVEEVVRARFGAAVQRAGEATSAAPTTAAYRG